MSQEARRRQEIMTLRRSAKLMSGYLVLGCVGSLTFAVLSSTCLPSDDGISSMLYRAGIGDDTVDDWRWQVQWSFACTKVRVDPMSPEVYWTAGGERRRVVSDIPEWGVRDPIYRGIPTWCVTSHLNSPLEVNGRPCVYWREEGHGWPARCLSEIWCLPSDNDPIVLVGGIKLGKSNDLSVWER